MKTENELLEMLDKLKELEEKIQNKYIKNISIGTLPKDFTEEERIVILIGNLKEKWSYENLYSKEQLKNKILELLSIICLIDFDKVYVVDSPGFIDNDENISNVLEYKILKNKTKNVIESINKDSKYDYYFYSLEIKDENIILEYNKKKFK